jgi:cyclopropane-fatty-acyl-phospholipid synthase
MASLLIIYSFGAILSKDMTYSCAVFVDCNGDLKSDAQPETLEDAQLRKMKCVFHLMHLLAYLLAASDRMILKKANVQPGDRVLEIGTVMFDIRHPL